MSAVTDPTAITTAGDEVVSPGTTSDPRAAASERPSAYPSRSTVNAIFTVAKSANMIHQIVSPGTADWDDDDDLDDDLDDDDDDDDDDDYDDDYDEDDLEDMKEGDEPMSEQEHHQAANSASHNTNGFNAAPLASAMVPALLASGPRDPTAARYQFQPEKVQPENQTSARGAARSAPTGAPAAQPPTPASIPATTTGNSKGVPIPPTKANVSSATTKAVPPPAATPASVSKPVPAAGPTSSVPDVAKSATPTPAAKAAPAAPANDAAPAKPKVDPLAPTAAAPYGYKIVTVKKPDGTVAKVKRPLKEGEKAPAPPAKKASPAPAKPAADAAAKSTSQKPVANAVAGTAAANSSPLNEKSGAVIANASKETQAKSDTPSASNTASKVPDASGKTATGVRITEKELEAGVGSDKATVPPRDSRYRGARTAAKVFKVIVWFVCILFPLFFIGLGIATALLNNKPIPTATPVYNTFSAKFNSGVLDKTDALNQAIKVAASAWPIVFAAVVAQSLKMYAAHRVERGIKLVTLEQLISSHSVGGAIKQPFMLRTFNFTTVFLLFIWCLSPLAGQAILRMSGSESVFDAVNTTVTYYSSTTMRPSDYFFWGYDGGGGGEYEAMVDFTWFPNSITTALIQGYSQTENNTQDAYRNVKVLAANNTVVTSNPSRFQNFGQYTSLLGYPFWIDNSLKNDQQNTEFWMTSSYFTFNCSAPIRTLADSDVMKARNLSFDWHTYSASFSAANSTRTAYNYSRWDNHTGASVKLSAFHDAPGANGTLYFSSMAVNPDPNSEDVLVYVYDCPYRSVVVNQSLWCYGVETSAACEPQSSHPVEMPQMESSALPLGYWFPLVMQTMAKTSGKTAISQIEQFLRNPYFAAHQDFSNYTYEDSDLARASPAQISERLTMLVNTVWALQLDATAFVGPEQDLWFKQYSIAREPATATKPEYKKYIVFWPWLGVLFGCSAILMVAALAAAIWETRVVGPDFLGFANTAVKKSVKLPKHMSTMDARDRLHALQECEVLLQDTRPDRPVGRIALGVKEDSSSRLVPGRQYR